MSPSLSSSFKIKIPDFAGKAVYGTRLALVLPISCLVRDGSLA
jgi:hypothetical protein